jgi:glutamate/aspartate transport system substrate-binding protein
VRTAVKANSKHQVGRRPERQDRRHHHRHHLGGKLLRKNKRAGHPDFKEVYGKDHADSFLLLESGRADAFVMDDNILAGLIAKSKAPKDYKIVGETLAVEPIAIMIRKDDPKFKKAVDDSIKAMKSGELPSSTTSGSCKPIPPEGTSVGLPLGKPPRTPGPTRTTSRPKSTSTKE